MTCLIKWKLQKIKCSSKIDDIDYQRLEIWVTAIIILRSVIAGEGI